MNSVTVIIARHHEDISWVDNLKYPYIIYNKGLDDIKHPSIKIENFGKESGTYMHHIITNYNNLSDFLILLQDDPFHHCPKLFEKIENPNFNEDTLIPLGLLFPNDLSMVPDDHKFVLNEIVNEMGLYDYLKNFESPQYDYVNSAQFIISKKYILTKSLDFWKKLYNVHQKYYLAPHVLERMFLFIFNYTDI